MKNRLLPHLLAAALLTAAVPSQAGSNWSAISGDNSGIREARTVVITNAAQWRALWKEHTAGNPAPRPKAVFTDETIVAVFLGERTSGGYSVSLDVKTDPSLPKLLFVRFREKKPAPGGYGITLMTHPFVIRKYPGTFGKVAVADATAKPARKQTVLSRKLAKRLKHLKKTLDPASGFFDGQVK